MAYANKYQATFATKSGKTVYLYLAEDGYLGSIIQYQGVHIDLQYIPNSDDPFEPIFASQLNIVLDVTDNISNMPNLVTLNDRKYNAKLYIDTDLEWEGWVLSDSVQLGYSTGRRQLSFNAIDGLGLLKDILLPIDLSVNSNKLNTLLYYINLSLNTLLFPDNPNLKIVCSYYASGMSDRGTHTYSEPFSQTYLPNRTFLNNYVYNDCLTVISNIIKSFGCRIFQAKGKWWIVAINEFANINAYFTEYDFNMSIVDSGTINTLTQIQGYTGNTSNLYFIDNSQIKLLRKGYNKIQQNINIQVSDNYASNGNFRPYVGNVVSNWNASATGTGSSVTIVDDPTFTSAQYRLVRATGGTAAIQIGVTAGGNPAKGPFVNGNNVLNVSWIFQGQDLSSLPRAIVYLYITDGTFYYYWDGTNWIYNTITFMNVPAYTGTSGNDVNSYSFKTKTTPIAGQIFFKLSIEAGTGTYIQISDFKIAVTPFASNVNYYGYKVDNNQYVKTIDIPYGFDSPESGYAPEIGILLNSNGQELYGWYEYGLTVYYSSLLLLLFQKYFNIFGNNIVNVDCSLSSWNTTNGYINGAKLLSATDTDPSQINISSNSYMLGNSTINYTNDEIKATLLQISNVDVSATFGHLFTYNVFN
jgi:hypothetical protein